MTPATRRWAMGSTWRSSGKRGRGLFDWRVVPVAYTLLADVATPCRRRSYSGNPENAVFEQLRLHTHAVRCMPRQSSDSIAPPSSASLNDCTHDVLAAGYVLNGKSDVSASSGNIQTGRLPFQGRRRRRFSFVSEPAFLSQYSGMHCHTLLPQRPSGRLLSSSIQQKTNVTRQEGSQ